MTISRYAIEEGSSYRIENGTTLHVIGQHEDSCTAPCPSYMSWYDGPMWFSETVAHNLGDPKENFIAVIGSDNHLNNRYLELDRYVTIEKTGTGDYSWLNANWEMQYYDTMAAECFQTDPGIAGSWEKPILFQDGFSIDYSNKDKIHTADSKAIFHIGPGTNPFSYTKPTTVSLAPLVTTPKKR